MPEVDSPEGDGMDRWPKELPPEALAEWLNQRFDGTLMGHLGMLALKVGEERAVVELPVHQGLTTPSDHVHAGSMAPWPTLRPPSPRWQPRGAR